jgi:hypothetical protein
MEVHMATVAKPLHRSRVMVAMEALEKEQGNPCEQESRAEAPSAEASGQEEAGRQEEGRQEMTREKAIEIRQRQLQGLPVSDLQAREAIRVLQENPETLTPKQYARRRAHLGMRERGEPKVQVDLSNPRPLECPCADEACEADPRAVVRALHPWAVLKPTDEAPPAAPWPLLRSGT